MHGGCEHDKGNEKVANKFSDGIMTFHILATKSDSRE
jgi:hypothetical protein